MPVTLTFDVARVGLPASGPYTVERVGKDDGSFAQSVVTAANGKISLVVPQGAHIVMISAGDRPPTTGTLTLRQGMNGYAGGTDTYISAWDPQDKNYESSQTLSLRVSGTDPIHTGLLRFDTTKLPAGSTVRFAVLSVRVTTTLPNAALPLTADRITRTWKANEASWLRADAGTPWSVAGANGIPGDRAGAPTDTRTIYPP